MFHVIISGCDVIIITIIVEKTVYFKGAMSRYVRIFSKAKWCLCIS